MRALLRASLVALSLSLLGGCAIGKRLVGIKVAVPVAGEGITNPVHAANVGKVVFSTRKIERDRPDASALTTTFKDTDTIFARFYLPGPIANHFAVWSAGDGSTYPATGYEVRLHVDGQLVKDWGDNDQLSTNEATKSTRQIHLNPSEDPAAREASLRDAARWGKLLRTLPPGKHAMHLEVHTTAGSFRSEAPAATGDFTLERSAGPIKLGMSFAKYEPGMQNPDLEKQALEAVQQHASRQGWKERFERLKITGRDWGIARNKLTGVILYRSLEVAAFARWPDGHCTAQVFSVEQEHDGAGYQRTLRFGGVGQQQEIDCE